MLQKVRDSMKGSFVATIVFLLFVVPLVLTGVGDGSFLGSVAGNDAASVEGESISKAELQRAIYVRKQRLLGQDGVDPNAEFLKDENLSAPVLESLTRRAALVASGKNSGLGVSDKFLDDQIRDNPDFQVDGKFDRQTYQRLLSNFAYTPTTYKEALAGDFVLSQQTDGINLSSFSTDYELEKLVSLVQQKRTFYTIKVDKSLVENKVNVTEEDVSIRYEENKASFVDAEKMSLEYVELSVADISKTLDVAAEDVRAAYDQEVADFEITQEYEIAHLLIEQKDDQQALVDEVKKKIAEGVQFDQLVLEYSDDVGSKENGGNLGVMTKGVFPEPFEQAVYSLEQGQISDAVETDAGVHFIKAITKTVEEAPTFEVRKAAIENALKQTEAEEIYVASLDRLEELTFSAENLLEASQALNLDVRSTGEFTRDQGTGIANNAEVREVAFSEEVQKNDYNSKRIALGETRSIVVRKKSHTPERIKDLEEVREQIVADLTKEKVDSELDLLSSSLQESLLAGQAAEGLATEKEYEFNSFERVDRTSSSAGFQVSNKVFSMSASEELTVDTLVDREGNHIVIGLQEIVPGKRSDMADQQFNGLSAQLQIQSASFESASYEEQVVSASDIDIY